MTREDMIVDDFRDILAGLTTRQLIIIEHLIGEYKEATREIIL